MVLEQSEQLFVGDGDIVEAEPAVLVAVDVLQVVVHVADGANAADDERCDVIGFSYKRFPFCSDEFTIRIA